MSFTWEARETHSLAANRSLVEHPLFYFKFLWPWQQTSNVFMNTSSLFFTFPTLFYENSLLPRVAKLNNTSSCSALFHFHDAFCMYLRVKFFLLKRTTENLKTPNQSY
jgi:hypothetical protein